ncbi:MAG: NfeD family protein [Acholeplasmatales bacterium]|nr:NfeD family protein [Acholeplasmatales bacterium]
MQEYMIWIWLGVFVLSFILEAITQDLVSIWFGLGALVCVCISGFTEWWVQLIVFVAVSAIALLATRPLVKKILDRNERKTNSDDYVGQKVKTITDVTKFDGGEVKLNGIVYTAILMEDSDETIEKDIVVEVVAIKGNRLVIKKI